MSDYGSYFKALREAKSLTLREVEKQTGISNAYLSQIENGKIQQPSPSVLYTLSEIYGVDYGQLMEMAGHIKPSQNRVEGEKHGRIATFAEHNLTPGEEAELIEYLQFIRRKKRPGDKTG